MTSIIGGSVALVILVMLTPVVIIAGYFLLKLRRRNSIVRNSEQLQGVILASAMTKDGYSPGTAGSIATSYSEPGHIGRGSATQSAPTMKIRVRAELPGGGPFEYEEEVEVQRLDSVAVGANVMVYYDKDRPERATIAPDGYYEVNPGGYAFEPSPMVIDLRQVMPAGSGGTDNTELLDRLAALRDAGALSEAEFEAQKRQLLSS